MKRSDFVPPLNEKKNLHPSDVVGENLTGIEGSTSSTDIDVKCTDRHMPQIEQRRTLWSALLPTLASDRTEDLWMTRQDLATGAVLIADCLENRAEGRR